MDLNVSQLNPIQSLNLVSLRLVFSYVICRKLQYAAQIFHYIWEETQSQFDLNSEQSVAKSGESS
jgi:hypothetical protein